jgi:hypothetical protein
MLPDTALCPPVPIKPHNFNNLTTATTSKSGQTSWTGRIFDDFGLGNQMVQQPSKNYNKQAAQQTNKQLH